MSSADLPFHRHTRSGNLRAPFRAAALLLCAALAACAAPGGRPALLSSPMGPALEAMWEAAGGMEEWRRYETVGFTYEASLGPAAARLGTPPAGEARGPVRLGPERITFGIRDWSTIGIGHGDDSWDLALDSPPDRDVRDLALRGVRFLFCFPFVLGEPVWEFRRDIIPGLPVDPRGGFWAIPSAPGSPYQ